MKRPRVDVDLGELDQLLDHACEAPLSQGESARIKEALHALAEVLLSRRTSEKRRDVLPDAAGAPADETAPPAASPALSLIHISEPTRPY